MPGMDAGAVPSSTQLTTAASACPGAGAGRGGARAVLGTGGQEQPGEGVRGGRTAHGLLDAYSS